MRRVLCSRVAAVVVAASMGCAQDVAPASTAPEARAWLNDNKNPSAFATNRFGPSSAAIEFVNSLYASGAVRVTVDNIMDAPDRIREEGGPYADSLIVELPEDKGRRARIFDIHRAESQREGFDPTPDEGQAHLLFWWD